MAAMMSFYAEKCCRLLSALALQQACSSSIQFLIHSTFVVLYFEVLVMLHKCILKCISDVMWLYFEAC